MGVRALRRRAVFLDRDGVLNRAAVRGSKPYPPASVAELEITPGAAQALARLKARGFLLIVVTNQPDVARGKQSPAVVEQMHRKLAGFLPIDEFRTCYHDDSDGCSCRKPKPGLLREAAGAHGLELAACYLVGDRWRDVEAGRAAGCRTVWIDQRYDERAPAAPDARVSSLEEAVEWIVHQEEQSLCR